MKIYIGLVVNFMFKHKMFVVPIIAFIVTSKSPVTKRDGNICNGCSTWKIDENVDKLIINWYSN